MLKKCFLNFTQLGVAQEWIRAWPYHAFTVEFIKAIPNNTDMQYYKN